MDGISPKQKLGATCNALHPEFKPIVYILSIIAFSVVLGRITFSAKSSSGLK